MERRQDEEFGGSAVDDLLHLLLDRCDVVDHGPRGVDRDGESRPVVQVEQPSVLVVANSVQQDIQVMNCSLRNVGREDKILRQTSFLVNLKPYCFLYVHVIRNNTIFHTMVHPFRTKTPSILKLVPAPPARPPARASGSGARSRARPCPC